MTVTFAAIQLISLWRGFQARFFKERDDRQAFGTWGNRSNEALKII